MFFLLLLRDRAPVTTRSVCTLDPFCGHFLHHTWTALVALEGVPCSSVS